MKYSTFYLLLLCLVFNSCSIETPSKNPDLISKWQLIEVLQSTGGKAVFKPAETKETIEFLIDKKIRRSTSWCPGNKVNLAEYAAEEGEIRIGCGEEKLSMRYVIKGDFLLIYPNCIEECAFKYRRIDQLVGFVR